MICRTLHTKQQTHLINVLSNMIRIPDTLSDKVVDQIFTINSHPTVKRIKFQVLYAFLCKIRLTVMNRQMVTKSVLCWPLWPYLVWVLKHAIFTGTMKLDTGCWLLVSGYTYFIRLFSFIVLYHWTVFTVCDGRKIRDAGTNYVKTYREVLRKIQKQSGFKVSGSIFEIMHFRIQKRILTSLRLVFLFNCIILCMWSIFGRGSTGWGN